MTRVDTVVIGAGHAGLAVSRLLTEAGREHVVLDRGRVGERWRTERWDSLHLLTPNWLSRLPGWSYRGDDPEAFMSAPAFVRHLEEYAASFAAPVVGSTAVLELALTHDHAGSRYRVMTDQQPWLASHVVIATGPHGAPRLPAGLGSAEAVTANRYRNPAQLPDGGVLVVGASASGVQIADELRRAGREVTLSVGHHTRLPRRYRGRDIFWWLAQTGRLARTIESLRDPEAGRGEPSLQLVGNNEPARRGENLDLGTLQDGGVRLVGRLAGLDRGTAFFRDDLGDRMSEADTSMHRLLDAADRMFHESPLALVPRTGLRPGPITVPEPSSRLDLRAEHIGTVLLATGYRPDHSWIHLPVLAADGTIRQRRGVTACPGVYTVGQRFQHRRDSGLIDGARHDARAVVGHLVGADLAPATQTGEEPAA